MKPADRGLEMDQNDAIEKYRQADTLMEEERYDEALAVLDELYAAYPNEKELLYIRALCLEKVDRKHEAWGLAKRLIELHDDPRGREIQMQLEGTQQPVVPPPPPFGADAAVPPMPTGAAGDPFDVAGVLAPPPPPIEVATGRSDGSTKYVAMAVVVLLLLIGATLVAILGGGSKNGGTAPAGPAVATAQQQTGPVSMMELDPSQISGTQAVVFVVILLLLLVLSPVPLYLTLLFRNKLPGGVFLAVYFKMLLVSMGIAALGCIPFIGWIVGIYILYKLYNMDFVDFLILAGMSLGFSAVAGFVMTAILYGFGLAL
jgi:hypothetical protein